MKFKPSTRFRIFLIQTFLLLVFTINADESPLLHLPQIRSKNVTENNYADASQQSKEVSSEVSSEENLLRQKIARKFHQMIYSPANNQTPNKKPNPFFAQFRRMCETLTKIEPAPFLSRFLSNKRFADCYFIVTLIYLNRLIRKSGDINIVNAKSFHRMFLAAFFVAIKYLDDYIEDILITQIRVSGGITKESLITLDYAFVRCMNFDLYVSPEQYNAALANLTF